MKYLFVPALILAFVVGATLERMHSSPAAAATASPPSNGWTIHIDAQKHFGDMHQTEVAHHWCKPVAGGMIECQIYDSDASDAHLVAVETIVGPKVYASFTPAEQAMWHYHKVEIPKVNASTPDMTPEESAKLVASLMDTYGKVWLLWDPMTNAQPIGSPTVVVLK